VYLKSMIVVQNDMNSLSYVVHPPIDRRLIQNISKDEGISHPNRANWKKINWTQLNRSEYKTLISDFRLVFNGKPFWIIEKYWSISDD
ncbi:MAG TPA: hypothetical protein VI387_04350, partial [Candidatus Brocadiales bacterium]|nr:hypothetical protein [Candidatus Brocadiales bacterium]